MAATSAQIEQALSITGTYSLITGAVTLTDSTDWGSIGVATPDTAKILLQIYDSAGDLFYENAGYAAGTFTAPDMDLTDSTYTFTLPTDISGAYLQGQFLIKAKVQVIEDGETTVVNKNFYQNVCACCNDIEIDVQGSVIAGTTQVNLIDYTNYKTYTALSRSMTLYPPPPSGQASQTGTNVDTIVYSGTVYTGVWTWKITSDVTFTDADGTSTTCRLTGQDTFNVEQSQLCKVLCLLKKYRTQVLAALAQKNNTVLLQNYSLAMIEYQFATNAYICGNSQTVIDAYIQKIYDITGIDPDCDCGCDDGTSQPLLSVTTVDGEDGTDGTQIYSGTTAPPNGTGVVGDFYVDTVTKIWYKKTGLTTWTSLFSSAGSAGATGASGVSILYNSYSNTTVAPTGSYQTLDSFTMNAAQLGTDGDMIHIHAVFSLLVGLTAPDVNLVRIQLGGNDLIEKSFTEYSGSVLAIDIYLSRTGATASSYEYVAVFTDGLNWLAQTQLEPASFSSTTWANAQTIRAQVNQVAANAVRLKVLRTTYYHQT